MGQSRHTCHQRRVSTVRVGAGAAAKRHLTGPGWPWLTALGCVQFGIGWRADGYWRNGAICQASAAGAVSNRPWAFRAVGAGSLGGCGFRDWGPYDKRVVGLATERLADWLKVGSSSVFSATV